MDLNYQKRNNIKIVISIIAIVITIGLPLWIKTTTTYRASLPKSEIESLKSNEVK